MKDLILIKDWKVGGVTLFALTKLNYTEEGKYKQGMWIIDPKNIDNDYVMERDKYYLIEKMLKTKIIDAIHRVI